MGLECSGDVSDVCFHHMVEAFFILDSEIRKRFDIQFYCRFRDDILIVIGGTSDSRRDFVDEMKLRSRFFRLKVESIHEKYAVMLDLVVSKSVHFEKNGFLNRIMCEVQLKIKVE